MSGFAEAVWAQSELQFVEEASKFSTKYGDTKSARESDPDGLKPKFVERVARYICDNKSECTESTDTGLRLTIDCVRICFRSKSHMEAVESEPFVKALVEIIDISAPLIDASARGVGRARLVDVALRCICNGCFQNPIFATLIHSSGILRSLIAVMKKSVPFFLMPSCTKLMYLLGSQSPKMAAEAVGPDTLDVLCATAGYCLRSVTIMRNFKAHGYATDTVSWIFKLLYATESVMNDSSDPRYAGYRVRVGALCRYVFCLPNALSLQDESLFTVQNHAIQLLTMCPAPLLPAILLGTTDKSQESDIGDRTMKLSGYLLRVLSIQFWRGETSPLSLAAHNSLELCPLLILMTHLAQEDLVVRMHWKTELLETLSSCPNRVEDEYKVGFKLVTLMLSTDSLLKRYSSELMYILCDHNGEEFSSRLGIGNTIWYLKLKGLA